MTTFPTAAELVLRRRDVDRPDGRVGRSNVYITPPLTDSWVYRVDLAPGQAVVGFRKFGTIGVRFEDEPGSWNTNLPWDCVPERIVTHIWCNRGSADGIDPEVVVAAVRLIREAVVADQALGDEHDMEGRSVYSPEAIAAREQSSEGIHGGLAGLGRSDDEGRRCSCGNDIEGYPEGRVLCVVCLARAGA